MCCSLLAVYLSSFVHCVYVYMWMNLYEQVDACKFQHEWIPILYLLKKEEAEPVVIK